MVHVTEMAFDAPPGWVDGSVSMFEHKNMIDTGVLVVAKRGYLQGTLEEFIQRDQASMRRSLPKLTTRDPVKLPVAGYDMVQIEVTHAHKYGPYMQISVYAQVRADRYLKLTFAGLEAHRAVVVGALKSFVTTAAQNKDPR